MHSDAAAAGLALVGQRPSSRSSIWIGAWDHCEFCQTEAKQSALMGRQAMQQIMACQFTVKVFLVFHP